MEFAEYQELLPTTGSIETEESGAKIFGIFDNLRIMGFTISILPNSIEIFRILRPNDETAL